ncbi:hypothetical protein LguiA_019621 [Lonicera macranthoides]
MGDRDRQPPSHQLQVRPQHYGDIGQQKTGPSSGPSASQVLAVVTLLPVGGSLLGLAGLTLVGSLIGLAVATPLFVIFSPVLVPAALTIGLAVMAFLASGAFGLTALSSLTYVVNYLRQVTGTVPEQLDHAKRRMQDLAGYTGQKTKDLGQTIQQKAQEGGKEGGGPGGRKES